MSGAVIAANQSLKVNRSITGATTVNANAYAIVTYEPTNLPSFTDTIQTIVPAEPFNRYFGPGQAIPATITINKYYWDANTAGGGTITYTLRSGVEFINSP